MFRSGKVHSDERYYKFYSLRDVGEPGCLSHTTKIDPSAGV